MMGFRSRVLGSTIIVLGLVGACGGPAEDPTTPGSSGGSSGPTPPGACAGADGYVNSKFGVLASASIS